MSSMKVAVTVTFPTSILKLYVPSPLSIMTMLLPLLSVAAMVSSVWPVFGVTLIVAVAPLDAL